jgi:hypothetical protein
MKCHRNYTKVGKILGISDNAVRKRLKNNGYPAVLEEFLKYIDNNEK